MIRTVLPFVALAVVMILASACQEAPETQGDDAQLPATQGAKDFFDPRPGEVWTYRVERHLPRHARLSATDRERRTSLSPAGYRIEFERKRLCAGLVQPEGADQEFTCLDIFEDGELKERELYDVGPEGLFGRGWARRNDDGPPVVTLTDPIPVAVPRMTGGTSWEARSTQEDRDFRFRVIERAEVTVPAGTFVAARVQITSETRGRFLEHTIWFADNVGIIKEESIRSTDETILLRETSELVEWNPPDENAPRR